MNDCFLYIICNFEIFSNVNSMASKMAAKMIILFIGDILQLCLKKSSLFCYQSFLSSLTMYHSSELCIIKDVLDIYTQQKQKVMNAC